MKTPKKKVYPKSQTPTPASFQKTTQNQFESTADKKAKIMGKMKDMGLF